MRMDGRLWSMVMSDKFVWPSDRARAENDELNRVCEYLEEVLDAQSGQGAEPMAWYLPGEGGCDSQFRDHATVNSCTGNPWAGWQPLYTHPQPAQQGSVPEPFAYHCIRGGKDCFSRSLREGDAALWQMSGAAITPLFKNATPQPVGDGWIRCSDRLPAEADADCYGTIVGWDSIHDQAITIYPMAAKHRKGITHWKPTGLKRPQPPKEGGADEH